MSETAKVIIFDQSAGLGVGIGEVDTAAGVIHGVSIATAGVKAEGHEMTITDEGGKVLEVREWFTDSETLQTMLDACLAIGEPLKAKLEHGSGLTEIVGTFDNFRIDGAHLRADFTAIPTSPSVPHLMEIAKRVSKQFGVSVTANLIRAKAGAVDLMRAVKVLSADFVDSPAINAGLFSSKSVVDKQLQTTQTRIQKPNTIMEITEEIRELLGEIVAEKLSSYTESMQSVTDRLAALEKPAEEMSEGQKEEMQAAIKGSISELSAKFDSEKTALTEKVTELSTKLTTAEQLAKALGIRGAATVGNDDTGGKKDFQAELSAKLKTGLPYAKALHELNAEQPETVKAELSRRGLSNINLL